MGASEGRIKKYSEMCPELISDESGVLRHPTIGGEKPLLSEYIPGIDTMLKAFENSRELYGKQPFLGTRELISPGKYGKYLWKSYDQVYTTATQMARGIEEMNLTSSSESNGRALRFIGIFSVTREEWLMTDIATWYISVTNIPLYTTMSDEGIIWIFSQTGLSTVFLQANLVSRLLELKLAKQIKTLTCLIIYDEFSSEEQDKMIERGKAAEVKILRLADLLEIGKNSKIKLNHCKKETLMSICYTSGTTGKPKGAELTQNSVLSGAASLLVQKLIHTPPGTVYFSYLPLAHMYERSLSYMGIIGGFKIGYFHGDFTQIAQDMQELHPDVISGVPRIYNRFYEKMMEGINNATGIKKKMLSYALKVKQTNYENTGRWTHAVYDRLVFFKFRQIIGGNAKILISAAAPIEPKVLELLKLLLSCPTVQGYGLTETLAAVCLSYPEDSIKGSIGGPLLSSEIKLVDVPEMGYVTHGIDSKAHIPKGEICVRGVSVMKRYFKEEELTASMIDKDGWLHTGDIGEIIYPQGVLKIIDRKKNLFKLQQGEYVSPEKLENIYSQSKYIQQIFVHGESTQAFPIAIVVPEKRRAIEWSKKELGKEDFNEICESKQFGEAIINDLNVLGKEAKLAGFEMVKKIYLSTSAFSEEDETMTPTFKLKRYKIKNKYAKVLSMLYQEPSNEKILEK